ncbi:MAG: alkaline phosphatase family protein [Gammaproteobacteria bacterium]
MSAPLTEKVLLIGWDAADWKIISPLMDEGKMPNLERLVSRGVMGNLATLYPVLSPMLWTSIATGKRAGKHGIHGFTEPDPQTGGIRPITSLGRKTKAIWNILNQNGLKSNVIGWWPSRPVEPINGVMVSNHYHQTTGKRGADWPLSHEDIHPPQLIKPLSELRIHPGELEAEQILPFVPLAHKVDQKTDRRIGTVAKLLAECASVHAAATAIMQLEPWNFMGVYFDAIDHFCHGFMRYHPPRLEWVSETDYEIYKDVINGAYQFHDLMLGTYMQLAGDDTTIIIVSDHGFHPDHLRPRQLPNEPAGPASEHRPFGIFAACGPGIKHDDLVFGASLLDITPTVLTLLGLPLGRDMDGKPLLNAFNTPVEPEYIDSWDSISGDTGELPDELHVAPVDNHEALQQLIDLGYIDSVDTDQKLVVSNTVRELNYNLARDYMDAQQFDKAAILFRDLLSNNPDESRFAVKLFDCYLSMDLVSEAATTLTALIANKKRYAEEATNELAAINNKLEAEGKTIQDTSPDERKAYVKLLKKAGINTDSIRWLTAKLQVAEGKYEAALQTIQKAQSVQVHNLPSLHQLTGNVHLKLKHWQDAEACFQQALAIDPVNSYAHLGLCQTCLAQRKNKQALTEIQTSLGLIFHNPKAHFLHGIALHRCKKIPEAILALERAIQQNPLFPAAHKRLAYIYKNRLYNPTMANHHKQLAKEARKTIRKHRQTLFSIDDVSEQGVTDLSDTISFEDILQTDTDIQAEETIIIVSGLPRSGTSMMMQMLEAGGLSLLTDNTRRPDSHNQKGYYEYEPVKSMAKDIQWLDNAKGKGIKIIAQLLPQLGTRYQYRIIFMERPLSEIINSQKKMLVQSGKTGAHISDLTLASTYKKQITDIRKTLEKHEGKIQTLSINYHETLIQPKTVAEKVNHFLGKTLNETAMAKAVEPALHHQTTTSETSNLR